jgi:outer membrane autotransporter protein
MSTPLTGRLFADTMMFVGNGDNEIRRTQNIPMVDSLGNVTTLSLNSRTRMTSQEWLVQLGVGAQMAEQGNSWSIIPSLRFAYAGVKQGAATEKMDAMDSLGIKSDAKMNGTVLMRSGLEIAKDGRIGTVPVRTAANAAWVHDFFADPRRLGLRWQGAQSAPWTITTEQRGADTLRLGGSVEIGLGDRRTLRLYGEQEYLNAMKVFRGGVTFTIGF